MLPLNVRELLFLYRTLAMHNEPESHIIMQRIESTIEKDYMPLNIAKIRSIYEVKGKIAAIKEYRIVTGMRLLDAKKEVERYAETQGWIRP